VWNPKGHELFYRQGQKMFAVDYSAQAMFSAGKPKASQPLMLKAPEQAQAPAPINVVLNWNEELKQKVPAGKN